MTEVAEAYKALNARRQHLRTGLHQFYQKEKAELYRDAGELNELWVEIKKYLPKELTEEQQTKMKAIDKMDKTINRQKITMAIQEKSRIILTELAKSQSPNTLFEDADEGKEEQETNEDQVQFDNARVALEEEFFGKTTHDDNTPVGGLFGQYLEERANTYWFRDAVSSFAALVFQCFNYKTEAQERQEYLQDLRKAFKDYEADPSQYDALCDKINEGERFKPRSKDGDAFEKTLQSHLSKFKKEVNTIHDQNTNLEEYRETLRVSL